MNKNKNGKQPRRHTPLELDRCAGLGWLQRLYDDTNMIVANTTSVGIPKRPGSTRHVAH